MRGDTLLEWNAYTYDFNRGDIRVINILNNSRLLGDITKAFKECGDDKDKFAEEVRRWCMYYYWSKCEYEIIVSSFPPSERLPGVKIDVYEQIRLNWNVFISYVWGHKNEIQKNTKERG